MTTERVLFERINNEINDYMVHFRMNDISTTTLEFEVYPMEEWGDLSSGENGFSYIDKETEPESRDIFEEGKCLKKLEGSFGWRGIWEGRLYFTDEEYWGEEISELSDLYNNKIVPWCKDYIKKQNPLDSYDD